MSARLIVFAVVLITATVVSPPRALAASVSITDSAYRPANVRIDQGDSVIWTNVGDLIHSATQNGPLVFWDTGRVEPGDFGEVDQNVLVAAGTYPYHCSFHPSMTGAVRVALEVSPGSGTTKTKFTLTLSSRPQGGYVYDVQRRKGNGSWRTFRTRVATTTTTFQASSSGTYRFRSRLHRTSDDATSGWSPPVKVSVD
jgi:plastocyanin